MQQLQQEIAAVLRRNQDNRLTDDLIVGLQAQIIAVSKRAVARVSAAAQEAQRAAPAPDLEVAAHD